MDLGNPASYLVLADGTPVLSSDGREVGKVEHVLADADSDVFDGVIVDTSCRVPEGAVIEHDTATGEPIIFADEAAREASYAVG